MDPLTRTPISEDSPPLLAADAAFAKLCIICSRLCHLKAWIIRRRREVYHLTTGDSTPEIRIEDQSDLEAKIEERISFLEAEYEDWLEQLPCCFEPVEGPGNDEVEGDMNATLAYAIAPKIYKHKGIALVVAYGIGVQVQLRRLRNPNVPTLGPEIISKCHTILRIFAGLPSTCDGAM